MILASILIFLWAFLRHIPIVASSTFLSAEWTSAGKALALIGGALAIATTYPKVDAGEKTMLKCMNLDKQFITIGRICLGVFLIITGIQHFIFMEFVASQIPIWFPGDNVFWTWFADVALIAEGHWFVYTTYYTIGCIVYRES